MRRKVAITGLGAITALGEGAHGLWEKALAGRSGIDFVRFGADHHSTDWLPIGAPIRDFVPEKFISQRKALKVMARDIQLGVAAAGMAITDAGVRETDRDRFGVIVGSGVLNHELDELAASVKYAIGENGKVDLRRFGEEGIPALFPLWLLKYLPNMPACHISILFDLRGPNNTITTGASAGLQAVGEAFRIIERGAADIMLAGGAESKLNPVGYAQYKIMGVLSELNGSDPKKTYRPFNAGADGFVIGEGSGFVVLEELEHARRRRARVYAEIAGFGSSSAKGRTVAMRTALEEAKVHPQEISYLQACGLGLDRDDLLEAEAIEAVFNSASGRLTVSASKPVTGYTGFSAGALDLIFSTLALANQIIPSTLNFQKPKRSWEFHITGEKPVARKIENVMTNSFGFNGQCASMVTRLAKGAG